MIHCSVLIPRAHTQSTKANPYYLPATALRWRGAGDAFKGHVRCLRSYHGRCGPRAGCVPSVALSVGGQRVPQLFHRICHSWALPANRLRFFSDSLWYNMNFPCLVYVPRDKWWGKHFWSSFICQWQMQRFIWNTSKMEILTLMLQFRWKALPRWKASLLLWINRTRVTGITKVYCR